MLNVTSKVWLVIVIKSDLIAIIPALDSLISFLWAFWRIKQVSSDSWDDSTHSGLSMLLDVDFLSLLPEILPMDVQDGRKGQKIDDNEAANIEKVH